MELKEGNLFSLAHELRHKEGSSVPHDGLCTKILQQMLQAIDYLATQDIIHRDVKPDNILYSREGDTYAFRLGDFGLVNSTLNARTNAGTDYYKAPEVIYGGGQTHKLDVWSLFVTMMWTSDCNEFRAKCASPYMTMRQVYEEVANARVKTDSIAEMAHPQQQNRASAAQMLVKLYGGDGLCTPERNVPPLPGPTINNLHGRESNGFS